MVKRGYRKKLFNNAIEKVKELEREQVLQKVQSADSQDSHRVGAIFRYDKRLPNLSSIFEKDWQTMVDDDQRLLEVFPDPQMVALGGLPPARISRHEDGARSLTAGSALTPTSRASRSALQGS